MGLSIIPRKNAKKTLFISLLVAGLVIASLGLASVEKKQAPAQKPPSSETHASSEKPPFILVDNFDKGRTSGVFYERENSLGAYQGTWARRPSYAIITKSEEYRRETKDWACGDRL
jgi:hypothetical protein